MEATEESYQAFRRGLGRFFAEEGRLRDHTFWNDRYVDLVILAAYRETWSRLAPDMLSHFLRAQRGETIPAPDQECSRSSEIQEIKVAR